MKTLHLQFGLAFLLCLSTAQAAPDLGGSVSLVVNPPSNDKSKVEFTISIFNGGNSVCGNTWWADFWATYPCDCSTPPEQCAQASDVNWSFAPGDMPGGAQVSKTAVKYVATSTIPYRYLLYLDSFGPFCSESAESNNIICGEYSVTGAAQAADLVISSCSAQPDPESPILTQFSATVTNIGTLPTLGTVGVDLFADSNEWACQDSFGIPGDSWAQIPSGLTPGESITITKTIGPLPAGSAEMLAVVNGFQEVAEATRDNNCCTSPYMISDRPDLLISSFDTGLQANQIFFKGKMENQGYDDVGAEQQFKLCLFWNRESQPELCETPDVEAGEGAVLAFDQGLAIGQALPFEGLSPPVPNGVYSVWARVDCDCEVLEVDEKNNDAKRDTVVDIPGPDLQVMAFSSSQDISGDSNLVKYMVIVTNTGTEPVEYPFDIDLFFNSAVKPTLQNMTEAGEGTYLQGPPLMPSQSFQQEVFWSPIGGVPDGVYTSWVVVDLIDSIFETNEINNWQSREVTVTTSEGANLELSHFASRVIGNNVNFDITITNNGDTPIAVPFRIDLFSDRENPPMIGDFGDLSQEVQALGAGETLDWNPVLNQVPDGEYKAYALVDTQNTVVEVIEADNMSGPRLVVVCSGCVTCESDTYIKEPCVCGEETVYSGYCCGGEWFAVGCPEPDPDTVEDVDVSGTVEFDPGLRPSGDCGCRAGASSPLPSGTVPLLVVLALAIAAMRKVSSRVR